MDLIFDGTVVVVTGGAGGLGKSQALEFARRGARVVVNDLGGSPLGGGADASLAHGVVEEIRAFGGEAIANTDSVATVEGGQAITAAALDTWGRLDAIVTNAAIVRSRHFEDLTIEDWDQLMEVNLRGAFCTLQPAYQAMMHQGGGRIVTLTSSAGLCGAFGMASYASSKLGVVGLTRSIAWEGLRFGITANAVAPAAFDTRMATASILEDASLVGRPPELEYDSDWAYLGLVMSSKVTPMVVALAHESCSARGEVFCAFGGDFSRFVFSQTEGRVLGHQPSAEDVVAHWAEIRQPGAGDRELDEEVMGWMHRTGARLNKLASA